MIRHTALAKRSSFPSILARLGLVLALLAGIMGIIPASPAQANNQISTLLPTDAVLQIAADEQFDAISAGLYHTCGLKPDGSLSCWGYDGYGQVSGPNGSSEVFAQVTTSLYHTCGVKTDGRLACWGDNGYGQVSGPNSSPDTFTQISVGGYHTCGLKTDSKLACWGHNWYGQVSGPNTSSETFTQVDAALYHTCGVKADATPTCWGYDGDGQVSGPNRSSKALKQVSAGGYHTCGLETDGTLACWGNNDYGQAPSFNQPPTDIILSNDNLDENQPLNTQVGIFSTSDPNADDTHTYSLVNTGTCPGPDNGSFNIDANRLRTSVAIDYEIKSSYVTCVRTEDDNGAAYDKQFTIRVNNVNEAPINTVPGAQSTTVSAALIFSASSGTSISVTDVDAGGNPLKVTLAATYGTLTLNSTSGLTFSIGDGTADAHMVFTGTIANINTALDGMSFNLTPDHIGAANFQIITDDQGYTGAGGPQTDEDTVDIIVEPAAAPSVNRIFLPLIRMGRAAPSTPDLVVNSLVATGDAVTVTIKNVGTAAVVDAFWVDVYFNPTQTPTINRPWDTIASHGVVWGVTRSIPTGGTLTLTTNGDYYAPEYSSTSPLPVGAAVYALADSINYNTTYGAVRESNEENNLFGPVKSTGGGARVAAAAVGQGQLSSGEVLPPR
jgi:hypothetical protein